MQQSMRFACIGVEFTAFAMPDVMGTSRTQYKILRAEEVVDQGCVQLDIEAIVRRFQNRRLAEAGVEPELLTCQRCGCYFESRTLPELCYRCRKL